MVEKNKRILLVDDNISIHEDFKHILYSLVEKIHESDTWLIYKGRRKQDNLPVRVKFLDTRKADYGAIECFIQEMERIRLMDETDGIIRIYDVVPYTDGFVLVLEEPDGSTTLKARIRSGPTGVPLFFGVAVPLARTIGRLHHRSLEKKSMPENHSGGRVGRSGQNLSGGGA